MGDVNANNSLTRQGDSPMVRLRKANGREEPWRVSFWGLGNEAWGCGGHMSAEQYAAEARRFGTYCRDHGGNKLYRIAAGANSGDYAWTETLMKQLGEQDHNTPDAPGAVAPVTHEQVTATASGVRVHLPAHSFVTVKGRLA
ncbi:hypothetical protein ABGB18_46465 [Nonomuraea sp. B12E4]|uniref:hypothetical protein n=1 Tax=Nonomuraea sp. B12E4 TaxID=3153564 RepID=UPI00325C7B04